MFLRSGPRAIVWSVVLALASTSIASAQDPAPTGDDLAQLFPPSLGGQTLEVETYGGDEWMARLDPDDPADTVLIDGTESLLQWAGKDLADLTIATARHEPEPGEVSTIMAIRIRGTEAFGMGAPITEYMLPFESPAEVGGGIIADRSVVSLGDDADPSASPVTLYGPLGDISWVVDAREPLLSEIMAALPPPGGRLEVPELGVAVTFPDDWYTEVEPPGRMEPDPEYPGPVDLLGPDDTGWGLAFARPPLPGECSFALYETSDLTLQDLVAWHEDLASPFEGVEYESVGVEWADDLPAGEGVGLAGRVLFDFGDGPQPGPAFANYAVDGGDSIAVVRCGGDLLADEWLSIAKGVAETIEFLP